MMVLFLSIWHRRVIGRLSPSALSTFTLLAALSLVYGRLLTRRTWLSFRDSRCLTLQFLSGYLLLNILLLVLSLAFPFGIANNLLILAAAGLVLPFVDRQHAEEDEGLARQLPSLLSLLLSGVGATLWCTDSLRPIAIEGQTAIVRAWPDIFIHVRHISAFSQSHGLGTMSDIQMSGTPPHIYHYASYFTPAAVSSFTSINAFEVYASFLLPFGILLTGLAAFSLAASMWGSWPGLAAAGALILLPDAYQQGFANRYLSYNFLQQVNPGGFYGVACAALAWVFILDGCTTGRYKSILLGYVVALLTVVYKAHIFVANAFLVMLYPCLFLVGTRRSRRFVIGAILVALFVSVVALSQRFEAMPTLQLNGRSAGRYLRMVLSSFDPGVLKSVFEWAFGEQQTSKPILALEAITMLLLSTFGIWGIAFGTVFVVLKVQGKTAAAILSFPLLVVGNYLVMSLGLEMDTRGIGTPDEFLNRPLVWAYFVVVAWTAGAAYAARFGNDPPRGARARIVGALLMLVSLVVPWAFSANLQTFPAWHEFGSFKQFASYPLCRVRAALYIRDHSHADDIVQDSENDFRYLTTGLAERQAFVIANMLKSREQSGLGQRLEEAETFKRMTDVAELTNFAAMRKISWYLLHPTSEVSWPKSVIESAVYECDGYRVYHFTHS